MPLIGFNVARAGRRLGGGLLNTVIGFAIISGLGQLISPKQDTEIIKANAINGLELEHNSNMLEVKMEMGATIVLALIVIGCIGLCAKSILKCIKCKKMRKCFKKEEEKEKEENEDSFESFELEDI